jgi:hypothetical protein
MGLSTPSGNIKIPLKEQVPSSKYKAQSSKFKVQRPKTKDQRPSGRMSGRLWPKRIE